MLLALLALNIVVWGAALAYLFGWPRARRWNLWAALAAVAVAAGTSLASYPYARRAQVRERALKHYYAGIDERQRGNLEEAEKQFQQARVLDPANPDAARQLQEMQEQRPAERREQRKETRIVPAPGAQTSQNTTSGPGSPPSPAGGQGQGSEKATSRPPAPGTKAAPAAHKPSPFEITRYALDVDLDPTAHTLDGVATVRIRSRGQAVPALDFSLNPEFRPSAAEVDGRPVTFKHTNDLLTLTPARPLPAGGEVTVMVRYRRAGDENVQGGDLISERGTYLRSEARWYPATGELDFRAPVRVKVRVPQGYSAVSVGGLRGMEKDGKATTFHWETDRYASMVSLAAAKYVQQSVQVPAPAGARPARPPLKITCYTFPAHRDRAAFFLKEAAAMTRFYEQRFGPYPYEKLGIVEIPQFPGGYGTTSFVMLIDLSFAAKKLDREFVAHEIAHQWWGNSVFPQGLGAAWLTEAFANYSAWMYESAAAGNPRVLSKRVEQATSKYLEASARQGDQAIYETDPYLKVGAAEEIIYEKGAVVLHMLRREIGDRAFMRALRRFADEYRFGKAKILDFQKIAEAESGQQLGWFFDQWLGRTGGMDLAYSFETVPEGLGQSAAVLTVDQGKQPYRARMKVVLGIGDDVLTREIALAEVHQTFRFPIQGKLSSVLFDPDNTYLKSPPRWVVPPSK